MATKLNYYKALLGTIEGKEVYCDLKKIARTWFRKPDRPPLSAEEAYAQCVLDEFVMVLDENCGLHQDDHDSQMIMLGHQAVIADAALQIEHKKPDVDLHEIVE